MKPIGGFFEMEVPKGNNALHCNAISLSTARACLNFIIQQVKPIKIYIPYYTCDVVLDPICINKIDYEYYSINENLEPSEITLGKGEYILFINYFGIKADVIQSLINRYGANLIVDNSQGFFEKQYNSIWSFNSARKFFGVPDGAYLFFPREVSLVDFQRNRNIKHEHLIQRLLGNQEVAFKLFKEHENMLNSDLKRMSILSEKLLGNIDYSDVAEIRIKNFKYMHEHLKGINQFNIPINFKGVPLCYPFLPKKKMDKSIFHRKNVFIPTLWKRTKGIVKGRFEFEKDFADRLLPLPIDQRYSTQELKIIIDNIF